MEINVENAILIEITSSKFQALPKVVNDVLKLEDDLHECLINENLEEIVQKENALHEAVRKLITFKFFVLVE